LAIIKALSDCYYYIRKII